MAFAHTTPYMTKYETTESLFAGGVLEILLADWQTGEYILRLQDKENIVQGEFALQYQH